MNKRWKIASELEIFTPPKRPLAQDSTNSQLKVFETIKKRGGNRGNHDVWMPLEAKKKGDGLLLIITKRDAF